MKCDRSWALLFACWLVVTGTTLGSLFFSEVMELPPCSLCWYQRLFMFPLPIVIVDVDEAPGIRIMANYNDGTKADEVAVGAPVKIVFEDVTEEVTLFKFAVDEANG